MSKKLWGYARVSTREQNLARQLFELQKYVAKDDIFIDKQSGKNFDREQYKQLRAMVREGDELFVKSIDRLGRNKEGIKDELQYFKKKGVIVHILDFPQTLVSVEDEHTKNIMDMVTNLLIEVFGFVAEEERNMIRARQAEGIAAWRRTGKTKTGRPYGRPRKEVPEQAWDNVRALVKEKRIKTAQAWQLLGVSKNTYYRMMRQCAQEKED